MIAYIKIGNKYLQSIESPDISNCTVGRHSPHMEYEITTGPEKQEFSSVSVRDKVGILVDAMRFGDIERQSITIEMDVGRVRKI